MYRRNKQSGIYLVIVAIILVALISLSALALDVGRLLVLKNEMQMAVDAATLAAARELDGNANAIIDARKAAREVLAHNSHFAQNTELLSAEALPDEAFTFYCKISNSDAFANNCLNPQPDPLKQPVDVASADADVEATYVQIEMNPAFGEDGSAKDHFTIDLFFLPILRIMLSPAVADESSLIARALAGPSDVTCNFPPLAVCDPFEGVGSSPLFRDVMQGGEHMLIKLKKGANQWTKGNYGLLSVRNEDGSFSAGANAIGEYLADPSFVGCQGAVQTAPGQKLNKVNDAIETRFGDYTPPFTLNSGGQSPESLWPPDVNITEYVVPDPDDVTNTLIALDDEHHPNSEGPDADGDDRFGNGVWDAEAYWDLKYGTPTDVDNLPVELVDASRYEVYLYEVEEDGAVGPVDHLPDFPAGVIGPGLEGRRVLHAAVLRCGELGLNAGKETAVINDDVYGGFAEIFLLAKPRGAGGPNPDDSLIAAEFIRMGSEEIYSRDFVLYE